MSARESDLGFTGVTLLILSALLVGWLIAEALIPRAPLPRALHQHSIFEIASTRLARSEAKSTTKNANITEARPS